ncbi:hypothetical protein Drorol1_Dr00025045 [Drosera rotundifolia]
MGVEKAHKAVVKGEYIREGPCLSIEQQDALLIPFDSSDVKDALWDIDEDKSPSVDGYTATFFKSTWSIVGKDVCQAVLNFFETGLLQKKKKKNISITVLHLIAKGENPTVAVDYRPITCVLFCTKLFQDAM